MLVEDLIETLKKYPADADAIIKYGYPVDGGVMRMLMMFYLASSAKPFIFGVKDSKEN